MDMALKRVFRIENSVMAGFLYSKLQEAEKAGIEVKYKVELNHEYSIREICLVEAMGILFDYAMDKLTEEESFQKKMYFRLKQKEEEVTIKFACTSEMLSVDDMIKLWDKKEKRNSLFRLKQLAEYNNGKIFIKMKVIDDVNYLFLEVKLPCKDQVGKQIFRIHKVDSL